MSSAAAPAARTFVGREAELDAIVARANEAATGRAAVVWIEADAGAGKSALIEAALERLRADYVVYRSAADELAADRTLDTVHQLAPVSATDGFGAGLELLDAFARWQDDGPVAVVVEDLHWADVTSRQAFATAARRLAADRVLLLVASRPEGRVDGWERIALDDRRSLAIRLGPLDTNEVAELASRFGVDLGAAEAERLTRHTAGHALHVRTLLTELTPEQLRSPSGDLPAPRSLATTILARTADLAPPSRALVAALAVLNQRVPLDVVARVAEVESATGALDGIVATGLVTWAPSEVGTPIAFSHPLYRVAIYEDLPPSRREHLHLRAADVFDGDARLAHRVAAAGSHDQALAEELDVAASDRLAAGNRSAAARNWLWAASLAPNGRDADRFRTRAALASLAAGEQTRAAAIRDELRDRPSSAYRSLVMGLAAWRERDMNTAETFLLEAAQSEDAEIATAALVGLSEIYIYFSRGEEAETTAAQLLARPNLTHEQEDAAWTALAIGDAHAAGALSGLDRLRARVPGDAASVDPADARLLATRGMLAYFAGRTRAAVTDFVTAIRLGQRPGVHIDLPRAHLHLAQALIWSGAWSDALVQSHVARSLADDLQPWTRAQAHSVLAYLLAARGEWDASDEELEQAERAAAEQGSVEALVNMRVAHVYRARARGDFRGVIAAVGSLTESGDALPLLSPLSWWVPFIGALIDDGQLRRATQQIELLDQACARRGLVMTGRLGGLRAQLALAQGAPDVAEAGFRTALADMDPDEPMLERALLHHQLGRVLLNAHGNRRDAIDQLRTAHDLFAGFGAEPYRQRVDTDLAAAGLRAAAAPDGDAAKSALALTDRERDVAVLVSTGLTNKEVAADLYISTKAVEYHLRNIYGKLGITSRRELATSLAPG